MPEYDAHRDACATIDPRSSDIVLLQGEGGDAGSLAPVEIGHGFEVWNVKGFIVRADAVPGE